MPDKFRHKPNHGSLFENDHKQDGDRRPDFTGTVDVEGVVYWISAWKDTTQQGKRKLSLVVNRQEERAPEPRQASGARQTFPNKRGASAW